MCDAIFGILGVIGQKPSSTQQAAGGCKEKTHPRQSRRCCVCIYYHTSRQNGSSKIRLKPNSNLELALGRYSLMEASTSLARGSQQRPALALARQRSKRSTR